MSDEIRKGPGGRKPKLPAHLKRKVDTIGLLPHEWKQLREVGPSKGKAVSKLLSENEIMKAELKQLKLCECLEGTRDCICCPEHKQNWRGRKR